MAIAIDDVPERPTQAQLRLLRAHLPYSMPVLRRLQVAAGAFDSVSPGGVVGAGTSPYAHVLFARDGEAFAAAYVDLSKTPETAVWLYASDQRNIAGSPDADDEMLYPADPPESWVVDRGEELIASWSLERRARCRRLVLALLRHTRGIAQREAAQVLPEILERDPGAKDTFLKHLKVNLHDGVRYLLQNPNLAITSNAAGSNSRNDDVAVTLASWDAYDKWLFRLEDVPVLSELGDTVFRPAAAIGEDSAPTARPVLAWDCVHTPEDLALVKSRTHIPRTESTLLAVPSVALREMAEADAQAGTLSDAGVLQAWAFLGVDGSLWTLHTEPALRGRGLAKTLASRLFRLYCGVFDATVEGGGGDEGEDENGNDGGDGWIMADVSATNRQSQGVCRRLGAKRAWSSSWVRLHYDSLGDDE